MPAMWQFGKLAVAGRDDPVLSVYDHGRAGVFEQTAVMAFTLTQLLFRMLVLGDVRQLYKDF